MGISRNRLARAGLAGAASHNVGMDIASSTPLLGGLSPQAFMRRHWQKKPLLIRQALPSAMALLGRAQLFDLAATDGVESRVVEHRAGGWTLRHGPFKRAALPALKRPGWTLLVQGLDLHLEAARLLLDRFRFIPDARLDDVMVSYASDGGGVGPHVDSYDVFLLQTMGMRRWRVGRVRDPVFETGVPLKLLQCFEPEHDWLLAPGDMLYLPPGWGHDGVAEGECMTCSIGFRAPGREELGREVLQRLLDAAEPPATNRLYRDAGEASTIAPGRIPPALHAFAADAAARVLAADPGALACSLGELLSEPKPGVTFEPADAVSAAPFGARLDRRTRMLYDDAFVFINGESYRAAGRDAALMRRLADRRHLTGRECGALTLPARGLLAEWLQAGWLQPLSVNEQGATR